MSIEINTAEFEFSHGHLPRGRGTWAFRFFLEAPGYVPYWNEPEWAPGGSILYSEARKWALARAKELGATLVRVCS